VADLLARHLAEPQRPGNVPRLPVVLPAAVEKMPPPQEIPETAPNRRPRFRTGRWAAAAAMLLMLLGGLGFTEATGVSDFRGTVIRLFSPEGTLVVEVDDPGVSVKIDGSELVITGAGAKEIRLKPGSYTVEASKAGKLVSRELITVTKNGRQVVRVTQEALASDTKAAKEKSSGAQTKNPDRRAAEYVLFIGGTVKVNGQGQEIRAAADLPRESFRLTWGDLSSKRQVSDADLANFKGCKNLTFLNLMDTQVSDAGMANFKDCKDLTSLNLWGTQVGDAGLVHFKDCKDLTELQLLGTQVSDAGLAYFKDCKDLRFLDLNWAKVTDAGVAHFKGCKDLTFLCLAHTRVSDAALAHFKDCKNLTGLSLGDMPISDAGLAHLKDCKNLTHVHLDGTRVSDAGLTHFKDCKNLTELLVQKTKVTAAGIDELKKTLPKCKIEWDGGVIEPR